MIQTILNLDFTLLAVYTFILGACIGSFLNVVIYRLPKMLEAEWRADCLLFLEKKETSNSPPFNLITLRSTCPSCQTKIKFYHNIPLLSFIFLKGRCAYCQTKLSYRYPLIELITAALSLFCFVFFGPTTSFLWSTLFIFALITLTFIDLDTQYLPDNITLSLLWLGLIAANFNTFISLSDALYGVLAGYLSLWSVNKLFYLITKKVGMGNGDFKLFAALGAWLGWQLLLPTILIASFSGAIIGVLYLKFKHKDNDTPIPFGPYLCLGGFITFFWGNPLLNWYLSSAQLI